METIITKHDRTPFSLLYDHLATLLKTHEGIVACENLDRDMCVIMSPASIKLFSMIRVDTPWTIFANTNAKRPKFSEITVQPLDVS